MQPGIFPDVPVEGSQQLVAQPHELSAEPQKILLQHGLLRPVIGELGVGNGDVEGLDELRVERLPADLVELVEKERERRERREAGGFERGAEVGEERVDRSDQREREEFGFEEAQIEPVGGAVGVVAAGLEIVVELGEIDRLGGEEVGERRLRRAAKQQGEKLRLTAQKSGLYWDPG